MNGLFIVIAASALLVVLGQRFGGGVAETPAVLQVSNGAPATLAEASARAAQDGKPVVAIVTATWCGPCNTYKRGTLAEADVLDMLTNEAVTVVIDSDLNPADTEALGVRSLPTTVVLRADGGVERAVGALSASQLTALVRGAAGSE